jgi:hypothetical protein
MAKDRRRNVSPAEDARSSRSGEESGLARWLRRKDMARARVSATPVQAEDSSVHASADVVPVKTDADMLPIESLHEDSDYAAFLSPQVSEKLRRLALRKLFHLPQFNFRDGLDDYAEDYRNFEPLGEIITADMRHRMERELEALKDRLQTDAGGKHEDEKPAETIATGSPAAESAAAESPDEPGDQSTPTVSEPKRNHPSKG